MKEPSTIKLPAEMINKRWYQEETSDTLVVPRRLQLSSCWVCFEEFDITAHGSLWIPACLAKSVFEPRGSALMVQYWVRCLKRRLNFHRSLLMMLFAAWLLQLLTHTLGHVCSSENPSSQWWKDKRHWGFMQSSHMPSKKHQRNKKTTLFLDQSAAQWIQETLRTISEMSTFVFLTQSSFDQSDRSPNNENSPIIYSSLADVGGVGESTKQSWSFKSKPAPSNTTEVKCGSSNTNVPHCVPVVPS